MRKSKNRTLKIPIPTLSWKHIWLIVFVILAFRLDREEISVFLQWIMNKLSSN